MRAKIANFGFAKTGHNAVTTHILGTQGYIAPEYLVDDLVTTKMDMFVYGVVLLELVSGRARGRGCSAAGRRGWRRGRRRRREWTRYSHSRAALPQPGGRDERGQGVPATEPGQAADHGGRGLHSFQGR
jgi:serine/threonine protein kinase